MMQAPGAPKKRLISYFWAPPDKILASSKHVLCDEL